QCSCCWPVPTADGEEEIVNVYTIAIHLRSPTGLLLPRGQRKTPSDKAMESRLAWRSTSRSHRPRNNQNSLRQLQNGPAHSCARTPEGSQVQESLQDCLWNSWDWRRS